ncbi:hypothetical protein QOT17_004465 [Balamuthia mandrillaris]
MLHTGGRRRRQRMRSQQPLAQIPQPNLLEEEAEEEGDETQSSEGEEQAEELLFGPRLHILEQRSLAKEEQTIEDGTATTEEGAPATRTKVVHNVVKNTPFVVRVGLQSCEEAAPLAFNFNTTHSLEVALCFDCEELKEVPFLNQKPVDYRVRSVTNANKEVELNVDVKIRVLSSHCEHMMFRLRFRLVDVVTGEAVLLMSEGRNGGHCEVFSEAIRVVSKPEQIKTAVQQQQQQGQQQGKNATTATKKKSTKRTVNDRIEEIVMRMESAQRRQTCLLEQLFAEKQQRTKAEQDNENEVESSSSRYHKRRKLSPSEYHHEVVKTEAVDNEEEQQRQLEQAMDNLLDVYQRLDSESKPRALRRLLRKTSARRTSSLCEMVSLLDSQGLAMPHNESLLLSSANSEQQQQQQQQQKEEENNFLPPPSLEASSATTAMPMTSFFWLEENLSANGGIRNKEELLQRSCWDEVILGGEFDLFQECFSTVL